MRLMLWFRAFTQLPLPAQSGADINKMVWRRHMCSVIMFPSLCMEHLPWRSLSLLRRFQPDSDRGSQKVVYWWKLQGFHLALAKVVQTTVCTTKGHINTLSLSHYLGVNTPVCTRFSVGIPQSCIFAITCRYTKRNYSTYYNCKYLVENAS